jgi:hypothetical protein
MAVIVDHDIWKNCLRGAGEFIVANADDLVGETDDLTSVRFPMLKKQLRRKKMLLSQVR